MTPRKPFVDALRGFAVVLMVINHTARWWLDPAVGAAREALIYTTMVLAGPTFLFLVGFSLALAYARALAGGRACGSVAARNLRRSVLIATAAFGLNAVVFPHDVLGARVLLSIALAIAVVTPLVPLVRRPAGRAALLALAVTVYATFPGALPALRGVVGGAPRRRGLAAARVPAVSVARPGAPRAPARLGGGDGRRGAGARGASRDRRLPRPRPGDAAGGEARRRPRPRAERLLDGGPRDRDRHGGRHPLPARRTWA